MLMHVLSLVLHVLATLEGNFNTLCKLEYNMLGTATSNMRVVLRATKLFNLQCTIAVRQTERIYFLYRIWLAFSGDKINLHSLFLVNGSQVERASIESWGSLALTRPGVFITLKIAPYLKILPLLEEMVVDYP